MIRNRAFLLLLVTLATVSITNAGRQSAGRITDVRKNSDGVTCTLPPAVLQIAFVADDIVRIRCSPAGEFAPDSSWAMVGVPKGPSTLSFTDSPDSVVCSSPKLRVFVKKDPCRVIVRSSDGTLLSEDDPAAGMSWSDGAVEVTKTMPQDEFYFGFGEKAGMLQRKNHTMTMWNTDIPAYHGDTDPLYQTIPFFYAVRNGRTYGLFFDNTYYSYFSMGTQDPQRYSFGATGGEINYYIIDGPLPADVYRKFTAMTGSMPLPPRWAVGYQQCRWSYSPESRVREIASNFRTKRIPCDVLYLDIDYMDGYRCFTWNSGNFPAPKKLVSDLWKDGFRIVTIIDPGIKHDSAYWVYRSGTEGDHFVKYPDGRYFLGKVWPGECVFPDFTSRATRAWWGALYKGLADTGIAGFWNDMNEPSVFDVPTKTFDLDVIHDDRGMKSDHRKNHNIYGMQMARGTYEGLLKLRPAERPFVLTRADYAGGQRYTSAWTGDNVSSWEHLKFSVSMCLNLSVSGQAFVGSDIGGFIGRPSGELYARWLQLGVFTPLMRSHSEINSVNKEPWEYGPEFESINRRTIELRYRLLPYLYTQFQIASTGARPIMRPLMFDYPAFWDATWNDREFLCGDDLLVAPVLEEGSRSVSLSLPPGSWYEFWTGTRYEGNKGVTVDAPIDRIPFFVKAGSVIPMQGVVQHTGQVSTEPLTFAAYPANGIATGMIYEDDGHTFAYRTGGSSTRTVKMTSDDRHSEIVFSRPEGSYRTADRKLRCIINNYTAAPGAVQLNGKILAEGPSGWKYDEGLKQLTVIFTDERNEQIITIRNR